MELGCDTYKVGYKGALGGRCVRLPFAYKGDALVPRRERRGWSDLIMCLPWGALFIRGGTPGAGVLLECSCVYTLYNLYNLIYNYRSLTGTREITI